MKDMYISSVELKRYNIMEWDSYPFSLPIVKNLAKLDLNKPVTFIVGDNGSGKSTLLEAIAIAYGFNAEGGSKNFRFTTYNSHSILYRYLRLVKNTIRPRDGYFFRAESFYNLATEIENLDSELLDAYGGKSLHGQSHGESFLSLMNYRLFGNGLYIFDEPEAALSPTGQMGLLRTINNLVNNNSQFIISTHSPIIMSYPNALIYEIGDEGIYLKQYKETDHYNITKYFLNNTERMLRELEILNE